MKVLFAVWELAPFFHVGGLGDIARSLPYALNELNIDIKVIIPYYDSLKLEKQQPKLIKEFEFEYDNNKNKVAIYQIHFINSKIPVYLIKNKKFLAKKIPDTFIFFNSAIIEILKKDYLGWQPEIIHCNDHHTGLIPLLIKHQNLSYKTLLTIHNLDHKGLTPIELLSKIKFDLKLCRVLSWEAQQKNFSPLLEGIIHADLVNTVSPTYAKEIMTETYGAGFDEILRNEKFKIYGILNGIQDLRNPETDIYLKYKYQIASVKEGKLLNKAFVQKKLDFPVNKNLPLIGFIGRFDNKQKGLDIIFKMLERLKLDDFQFAFLGTGDKYWEDKFHWLSSLYPKNIFAQFIFDNKLASQIYAGADFLLIPSRYEPCGLIQMIAMRYGTLPIARATGGLKDSIDDEVNGFLITNYTSQDLEKIFKKAINVWRNEPKQYWQMVKEAMAKDFSWKKSAAQYIALYEKLLKK